MTSRKPQFKDFLSNSKTFEVNEDTIKSFNLFKMQDSVDYQLNIIADFTFSAFCTDNYTCYLPSEFIYHTIPSFTDNYEKPILNNHNENKDPLGRIVKAKYISMADDYKNLSLKELANTLNNGAKAFYDMCQNLDFSDDDKVQAFASTIKKMWKTIDKAHNNKNWTGAGAIRGMFSIQDPDAIEKFLDKRYLTLSVGYDSGKITPICSATGLPFGYNDEHLWKGSLTENGERNYWIPLDLYAREVSVATIPAVQKAKILATGENLTLSDTLEFVAMSPTKSKYFDLKTRNIGDLTDSVDFFDKNISNKQKSPVIDIDEDQKTIIPQEKNVDMKLVNILTDTAKSYELLKQYLPEGTASLTDEELKALEDSVFVGDSRTLPIVNKGHFEAVVKLLDSVSDKETSKIYPFIKKQLDEVKDKFAEEVKASPVDELADKLKEHELLFDRLMKKIEGLEVSAANSLAVASQNLSKLKSVLVDFVMSKDSEAKKEDLETKSVEELEVLKDTLLETVAEEKKKKQTEETKTVPAGSVKLDDAVQKVDEEANTSDFLPDFIKEEYLNIRDSFGIAEAKRFLNKKKSQGILPESLDVEKLEV